MFISLSILIAAFVGLNLFAFVHGRAMTHFTDGGSKTAAPETLDFGGKLRVLFCGVSIPRPLNTTIPIRCPVLLMHGECDPRVTLDEVRRVYDAIPARKDLKLFSGLGHELYVTTSPDVWRQTVESFLNTLRK